MAKKSITKNYIYNLAYQILIIILPIITTPYLSRVLGAENIGIYSYTLSIVTYFILFGSLGISMYAQREIAYVQEDKYKSSKIFWEILILRFITLSISMVIYYFIYVNGTQYQMYYRILLIEIIATCFDISWYFQGMEDFKKTVFRNTLVKFVSIALIFLLVKKPEDLAKYFIIYVVSNFVGNISLWLYIPKFLDRIKIKELQPLRHLRATIGLFIPQIAIQIYTLLDKVMIGVIIDDKSEVGYYDQAQKIIKMLLTIVTSLGTVMIPRMANTFANGDMKQIKEYIKKSFRFVYIISIPMIFGIIAVSDKFVPVFFGNGYEKVSIIMKVISPILLIIGVSNVIGSQYLLPTKRQKEFTISVTSGAITNFIVNSIIIRKLGAVGASIGTVIAESIVTAIQIYFIRKDINLKECINISKKYIMIGLIIFIAVTFIGLFIKNNFISIIVQGFVGASIYIIGLYIAKDEFFIQLLKTLNNKIKNKKDVTEF